MNHLPFQYGATRNFCGIPSYTDQPYVVVGCPWDGATTFRSGARMGPNSIRNASMMLTDGRHTKYTVDINKACGDAGDIPVPSGYTIEALRIIEDRLSSIKSHCVILGGDHLTTLAALRSLHKKTGEKISLIHFDAHCDTWQNHFGQPFGHGTWLFNAIEEGLVNAKQTFSIGIRSPAERDDLAYLSRAGGKTVTAMQAMNRSPDAMADYIKDHIGKRPCYLSLDIDCLDPAFAPGTGTPEIGGLSTIWLRELLNHFGSTDAGLKPMNWQGMDLCEVAPAYDHSDITSLAAATFCWQYLSQVIYHSGLDK